MDTATVTLGDGLDHLMAESNQTVCGQDAPMGSPIVQTTTNPCPECFPDTAKPKGKKATKDADAA